MSESTRLGRARGKMLPVAIVAAALLAMLVVVPLASAASNPISGGTTTLTINKGALKSLKAAGIKITPVKPAKIKGNKATFAVTGGEIAATTSAGTVTHSGGLKIALGKKSVTLKSFTISTKGKSLSAKIGGKSVKIATLAGVSSTRLGFGNSISAKKVKLTGSAANSLNKSLAPPSSHSKGKKTTTMKPPFQANMVLGSSTTEVEPETDNVLPTGSLVFGGDATLLAKLTDVGVKVETIAPTTAAGTTFTSAISGGTISPLGTSGQVNSSGGVKLVQVLPTSATTAITTSITLGSIGVDLAAKTASVEVIGESNAESEGKKPLNLGNLGRSSIADLTIGSVTSSPATRSVAVSATGAIQPVAAEVLQGFVTVYRGYYTQVVAKMLIAEKKAKSEAEALQLGAAAASAKTANDNIKAGEALGSFSFTAIGE